MSFLYNFGISQEDERTESAALRLTPNDRVICIASAGEIPLSLAAMGVQHVTAVDIDPAQMALTKLKQVMHLDNVSDPLTNDHRKRLFNRSCTKARHGAMLYIGGGKRIILVGCGHLRTVFALVLMRTGLYST